MSKAHRGAPLYRIKNQIEQDFRAWCAEWKAEPTTRNLIEFLIQKNFIQGKEFLDYCDQVPLPTFGYIGMDKILSGEMLREGFMIPDDWIGYRKGKNRKRKSHD